MTKKIVLLMVMQLLCISSFAQPHTIKPPTNPETTRPTPAKPPRRPTTGTLSITSSPSDAAVKIDGEYMGTTPLTLKNRKAGTYRVTISAEGYETQAQSVTVAAGKTASCSVTLKKKTVQQPVQPQRPTSTTPSSSAPSQTFTVNGVTFKMIKVEGGTFQMGGNGKYNGKPVHQVTLTNDYYIGETEVTQALWRAVMGSEPTAGGGWEDKYGRGDRYPAYRVSWDDCQAFIKKLNALTGKTFRLPTEAEWEFAARGGKKSKGYTYSGSNTIDEVAWYNNWYNDNLSAKKAHEVAMKAPNELGIYDMSGNLCEWCQDWYGGYSASSQTDPTGPSSGSDRVCRGGSWVSTELGCRVSLRGYDTPDHPGGDSGLRLVFSVTPPSSPSSTSSSSGSSSSNRASQTFTVNDEAVQQPTVVNTTVTPPPPNVETSNASFQTFTVNGVTFNMIKVEGGTFKMGSDADADEDPVHQVTLTNDYYIGETEVTQALWKAVMGGKPTADGGWKKKDGRGDCYPAYNVSWDDCQIFITKLNTLTGQTFRLPTEAEWEFAARGGKMSLGCTYSGSNTLGDVAWYSDNSEAKTHEVAAKAPNELRIYDMTGNVWEWCQDWKGSYSRVALTNPSGPTSGSDRIFRGGGWGNDANGCRVAYRGCGSPLYTYNYLGFRLAL